MNPHNEATTPTAELGHVRGLYYRAMIGAALILTAAPPAAGAAVASGGGSSSGGSGGGSSPTLITTLSNNAVAIISTIATAMVAWYTLPKLVEGLRKHNVSMIVVTLLLGGLVFFVITDPGSAFTKVGNFASELAK